MFRQTRPPQEYAQPSTIGLDGTITLVPSYSIVVNGDPESASSYDVSSGAGSNGSSGEQPSGGASSGSGAGSTTSDSGPISSKSGGSSEASSAGGGVGGNDPQSSCATGTPSNKGNDVAITGQQTDQIIADKNDITKDLISLGSSGISKLLPESVGLSLALNSATALVQAASGSTTIVDAANDSYKDDLVAVAEPALLAFGAILGAELELPVFLATSAYEYYANFNTLMDLVNTTVALYKAKEAQAGGNPNNDHSSGANGSGANNCGAGHDPIVIDLTGNGLNITPLSQSSTYFDFNGNGFSVNTAWIGSGTGFLVIKSTNAAFGVSIGDGYEMLGTGSESGYAILQSLTAGFAYRNGFRPGAHLNAALKD